VKQAKKKGLHPAVAVLFLLVSGGIALKQFVGGGLSVDGIGIMPGAPADDELALDGGESQAATGAVKWSDLLAVHGSYAREAPVRMAFASVEVAAGPAAPGGEIRPPVAGHWVGEDPPTLQLGVVMVSAGSRRAVVGGRVVGIGDALAGGRVTAIERGQLVLAWGGRALTYDLEAPQPREFREELRRRASAGAQDAANGNREEVK
jgi:hypothetical protein